MCLRRRTRYEACAPYCLASATGALAYLTFSNGLLLLFLQSAGFDGASALLLMSLYGIVQPILLLPFAYIGDRHRRRMLLIGTVWTTLGFGLLSTAPCAFWRALGTHGAMLPAAAGIAVFATGVALLGGPWFAILSEIIPSHMRGSYLGRLRLSWQLVGLAFGIGCTFLLGHGEHGLILQIIVLCCVAGLAVRAVTFRGIPRLERQPVQESSFRDAVWAQVRHSSILWILLLRAVRAHLPCRLLARRRFFSLIEKDAVGFHDTGVVWMGNGCGAAGAA